MRMILRAKWAVLAAWIAVAVILAIAAPSLSELVKEHGTIGVPDGYSSAEAIRIMDEVSNAKGNVHETSMALVFHNPNGMTDKDTKDIQQAIQQLNQNKNSLHIVSMLEPYGQSELKAKLISKDNKTVLTSLLVSTETANPVEIRDQINKELASTSVEHYITGQKLIENDQLVSSQEGLKKSELITVVFILAILFFVFRSIVAAFIPLLTVGLSYIISQSIVAFLVESTQFPLSTFTQIFMVAVLFGIGTDYCILLLSRYKEELAKHDDLWDAIAATYRTAGKTVLFSGIAVLVGFSVIGFSEFNLYRSAVAVAIGIAIMLLALVTVVPFFMAVLGKKLFWPAKKSIEHKESRSWGAIGSFSLRRPLAAMLVVAAVTVPFLISYKGEVSFNSLEEIGDKYDSVKAFNIIADSFEPGESMPTQVVIKSYSPLQVGEYMPVAEKMSRELIKVDGVSGVRSLSRPAGDEIKDFQITEQVKTLDSGLSKGNDGLSKIKDGLSEASNELSKNEPKLEEAASGAAQLTAGTQELKSGIKQLNDGLGRIESGIRDGSAGAGQLQQGLKQAKESAQKLAQAHQKLLDTYKQIGQGLTEITSGVGLMNTQFSELTKSLQSLTGRFASLEERFPDLLKDADYMTIRGTVTAAGQGAAQLSGALGQMQSTLAKVNGGMAQANQGYEQATTGQKALASGYDQLIAGISQLESGLKQAANGQGQIISKVPGIITGLDKLQAGQKQIGDGFSQLSDQIGKLTTGLKDGADGLTQVSDGLNSAQGYLQNVSTAPDKELGGWFVPDEVLSNDAFRKALDMYLSEDHSVMTLDVIFADNPYGTPAIDRIDAVKAAVDRSVKGTSLEKATIAVGGVSSTFADLKQMSGEDYMRTVTYMIIGILLILIVLFRSIIMPLYIVASLLLTFFTSMGITEVIFTKMLDYSGVTWAAPFFGFVMLMALGVDYSIFLMERFNENKHLDVKDAILYAMKNMGTVIISAVIILGGTFASFYPSGVLSMMQIATVVLSGLTLYTFLILPFFVPVMVKTFGSANWWPFFHKQQDEKAKQQVSA
ncbi:MMPL family transporter [Paenibacillus alvei]|uniref:MMPL/RND family transporter n=1 Tax=Paenibacillus alvei TaxID=44250 RepID=UPI00227E2538|nr:MMPL family transporter [Paenibacillus alvei]MCY7486018.1 MMPL family transporter [Paenibacillus alvei]